LKGRKEISKKRRGKKTEATKRSKTNKNLREGYWSDSVVLFTRSYQRAGQEARPRFRIHTTASDVFDETAEGQEGRGIIEEG